MFNPETAPYAEAFLRQAEAGAVSLGLKLTASPIHNDPEIEHTINSLTAVSGGGLIVLPEAFTNTHSPRIIELTAQHTPAHYLHVPIPSRWRRSDILRD